jgi:hypothetical protein
MRVTAYGFVSDGVKAVLNINLLIAIGENSWLLMSQPISGGVVQSPKIQDVLK